MTYLFLGIYYDFHGIYVMDDFGYLVRMSPNQFSKVGYHIA